MECWRQTAGLASGSVSRAVTLIVMMMMMMLIMTMITRLIVRTIRTMILIVSYLLLVRLSFVHSRGLEWCGRLYSHSFRTGRTDKAERMYLFVIAAFSFMDLSLCYTFKN